MKKYSKYIFAFLSILVSAATMAVTVDTKTFDVRIEKNSYICIKGTSNVNSFLFEQKGPFVKHPIHVTFSNGTKPDISKPISLPIEIDRFDCDNKLMKHDFFTTLNADECPYLTITITKINLPDNISIKENTTTQGNVKVTIKLAGSSCDYTIPFLMTVKNHKLVVLGEKSLSFSDFNLTPPSKLFGAIQVNNSLMINVNLVLSYAQKES